MTSAPTPARENFGELIRAPRRTRGARKPLLATLAVLACLGVALLWVYSKPRGSPSTEAISVSDRAVEALAGRLARLEARERRADETAWAAEMCAQECGRTFEDLWDALNATTNKLDLVAAFPVGSLRLGRWTQPRVLAHGIEVYDPSGPDSVLPGAEWRGFVDGFARAGWQLSAVEFRHNRFDTNEAGLPRQSQFYFAAHLTNPTLGERAILEGDLGVDWAAKPAPAQPWAVKQIDATRLVLKTHRGEPPFRLILDEQITPPEKSNFVDPLILYDLDGNGLSEIILPTVNRVYRRGADDRYVPEPLCRHPPGLILAAIIADFDGDGSADLLCTKREGLVLSRGSPDGAFDNPGIQVWTATAPLKNVMALTCGDIDQDGDLDVFIGQYKVPTLGAVLKPHYYEANDGWPAYLLLNDGSGRFTEGTAAAGLDRKRWRRTYAASWVDLDHDGALDLLVASDFAGLDLYRNDGRGHFTDVTAEWVNESHAFGMAETVADFNADGRLDFLMIGMPSATADRLEHLHLWRPEATEDHSMRSRMTFGNRLYLARASGGFEQTPLGDSLARSGWSWGCGAFDFDNDGYPDVYIANGQQTKQSVREYEPEFWLHDIYVDDSVDDAAATAYFVAKFGRTRGQGWSYGGYEKNRFYLNQRGLSFVEVGHLAGVALEQDCRNVVADDLDGDGRVDLLVTTSEVWPAAKETLRVYRNTLADGGNWIGFRFREEGGGRSPVGVRVALQYRGHRAVGVIVIGDAHRSQHPATLHFGLAEAHRVDSAEIRWPDGQTVKLREPVVNRYHSIRAPRGIPRRPSDAVEGLPSTLLGANALDSARKTGMEERAESSGCGFRFQTETNRLVHR